MASVPRSRASTPSRSCSFRPWRSPPRRSRLELLGSVPGEVGPVAGGEAVDAQRDVEAQKLLVVVRQTG